MTDRFWFGLTTRFMILGIEYYSTVDIVVTVTLPIYARTIGCESGTCYANIPVCQYYACLFSNQIMNLESLHI